MGYQMNFHSKNAISMTYEDFENEAQCVHDDVSDTCESFNPSAIVCGVTEYLVAAIGSFPVKEAVFTYLDVIAHLTKSASELEVEPA